MPEPSQQKIVEVIIPLFNEEQGIQSFHRALSETVTNLPYEFRFTYVNDGSTDDTQAQLEQLYAADARIRVVELSRNFGHQAALSAGLDLANADFVITMDGDGEHPPAMIPQMLRLAEDGVDIVIAQRTEEQKASWFKRWSSNTFYRMINRVGDTKIAPGAADFRLITRPVLESLRKFHEYHRFLRGLFAWMGFRSELLPYTPGTRIAGRSKYSLRKMMNLAANAIFSFSLVPLYIAIGLGGLFLLLALIEAIYVLSFWISGRQASLEPGWSSLMFILLIVGGTVMISLGFIGIYVGYIFQEVKGRPPYLVRRLLDRPLPDSTPTTIDTR
jgi:dolichol-phosphate mannosyltransferase